MSKSIKVSSLPKTWILDIDGTIVKHNGYKIDGQDMLLDGAKEFLDNIPAQDMIIFITSRTEEFREETQTFLKANNIRFNHIIYGAPYGERVLINDKKTSGLPMAIAINTDRDVFTDVQFEIDDNL